jgi:predicted lactoylglutathione lyase
MSTKIFVNLPVKDLRESMGFFDKLGFTFNPQFTDETAACMMISDSIYAMLLTHAKFKEFTPKAICDATKSTEVLVCLSCESRARSTTMSARPSRPAGRLTMNRRIRASCTLTASRTLMGTSGN